MVRTCFVANRSKKRVNLTGAAVAQSVEHFFGKEEVDGSNPFCGFSDIFPFYLTKFLSLCAPVNEYAHGGGTSE